MYAVIETGGKQFRVQEGDVIDVELSGNLEQKGTKISFDRVLMVGGGKNVQVGSPLVSGASVVGLLVDHVRGPKIRVFKKKRRKGYKRSTGHRQDLRRIRIEAIKD